MLRGIHIAAVLTLIFSSATQAQQALDPEDQKALRDLDQQVGAVKEQIYQTKARTHDLKEAVLRGKITGSKAFVTFENQAEGFFAFASAEFYLDDQLIKKVVQPGKGKPISTLQIFDGDLPSGEHSLKGKVLYTGSDRSIYKTFPYFKEHQFQIETVEKFNVEYGKTTLVKLVALDKGYFKTDLKERLYLQVKVLRDWGTDSQD
jgi:hypothetical protein